MKIVSDWRQGWKWTSVHLSLAGVGFNAFVAATSKGLAVAMPLFGLIPTKYVGLIGGGICLASLMFRFVSQKPKTDGTETQ